MQNEVCGLNSSCISSERGVLLLVLKLALPLALVLALVLVLAPPASTEMNKINLLAN